MEYTYKNKRVCRNCGAPLPDQYSIARIHCKRTVLPDGSIQDCKSDYWNSIYSIANEEFKNIAEYHKKMFNIISKLYALNGDSNIDSKILDAKSINLMRCVEIFVSSDSTIREFRFVKYGFQTSDSKNYKIIEHGRTY